MLVGTAQLVQPSHVVELQTPLANRNLPPEGSWLPACAHGSPAEPAFLCTLPALGQTHEQPAVRCSGLNLVGRSGSLLCRTKEPLLCQWHSLHAT